MKFNKKKTAIFLSLSLLLLLGITMTYDNDNIDAVPIVEHEAVEKVALYYNIDSPDVIYTTGENGEFVEVEIDG